MTNVLEFPEKATYPIFIFVLSLFSRKKSHKIVNLSPIYEKLPLHLLRHKQA